MDQSVLILANPRLLHRRSTSPQKKNYPPFSTVRGRRGSSSCLRRNLICYSESCAAVVGVPLQDPGVAGGAVPRHEALGLGVAVAGSYGLYNYVYGLCSYGTRTRRRRGRQFNAHVRGHVSVHMSAHMSMRMCMHMLVPCLLVCIYRYF